MLSASGKMATTTTSTTRIDNAFATALIPAASTTIRTSHPNPSLQVTADHQIKMVEAPVEEPGPGEVLLHIKATGVCG